MKIDKYINVTTEKISKIDFGYENKGYKSVNVDMILDSIVHDLNNLEKVLLSKEYDISQLKKQILFLEENITNLSNRNKQLQERIDVLNETSWPDAELVKRVSDLEKYKK